MGPAEAAEKTDADECKRRGAAYLCVYRASTLNSRLPHQTPQAGAPKNNTNANPTNIERTQGVQPFPLTWLLARSGWGTVPPARGPRARQVASSETRSSQTKRLHKQGSRLSWLLFLAGTPPRPLQRDEDENERISTRTPNEI